MKKLSAPQLWPQPQWAISCDELDFGRVRPGQPVERAIIISNVGGDASLHLNLQSAAPWVQMRAGEGAAWKQEVEMSLQHREEVLLLCRADPSAVRENWGGP